MKGLFTWNIIFLNKKEIKVLVQPFKRTVLKLTKLVKFPRRAGYKMSNEHDPDEIVPT